MLAKKYRLPLKTEFGRIKKQGRLYHSQSFSLLLAKQSGDSRFAFVVSKKIDKRAVKRNRVRRLLTESVRSLLPRLKSGMDVIFLAKKEITGRDFSQLSKEVNSMFTKLQLLKNEKNFS